MNKTYISLPQGQIHLRQSHASIDGGAPPLLCLHPMPYSGLFYDTVTPFLAARRPVLSPDYPGYGASDAPGCAISIEVWARSMGELLSALALNQPVDVLGFHTGCLVGPELALQFPDLIRRLVLVDVPWFEKDRRDQLKVAHAQPPVIDENLESIASPWKANVASKLGHISADRAFAMLAEQLRTGTRVNEGFAAAFSYDCEQQFRRLQHPALIIGTASALRDPSEDAADAMTNAEFLDCPEVSPPAFETGAERLAELTLNYLDAP